MSQLLPTYKADAALFFVGSQYMFQWEEDGAIHSKLLSPETVRSAFNTQLTDSGWLHRDVRRWGIGPRGDWAVMFVENKNHMLTIHSKTVQVPLPPLVFLKVDIACYVWAVKKFAPTAELYHALLSNVHPDGKVCFGNNKVGGLDIGQAWQLFIESPFNSDLKQNKSRTNPDDVNAFLKSLTGKTRKHDFPAGDLVLCQPTVVLDTTILALTQGR
jgi:hypothetical protein